jgi:long-chain fatty acid transport protein
LALGGQYKISATSALDFGYAHIYVKNATIDQPVGPYKVVGSYQNSVDILSMQYAYSF